jgi:hypothetical protein
MRVPPSATSMIPHEHTRARSLGPGVAARIVPESRGRHGGVLIRGVHDAMAEADGDELPEFCGTAGDEQCPWHTDLETLDGGAPVSIYTASRGLGHTSRRWCSGGRTQ